MMSDIDNYSRLRRQLESFVEDVRAAEKGPSGSVQAAKKTLVDFIVEKYPPSQWEREFCQEIDTTISPNEKHINLVFSDGEVCSTKGSWAFLNRSMRTLHDGHPTKACIDKLFSKRLNGFGYITLYDEILALALGECLTRMLDSGRVASHSKNG